MLGVFYANTSGDAKIIKDLLGSKNDKKLENEISIYYSLEKDSIPKENHIPELKNIKLGNEKLDIKYLQGKYNRIEVKSGFLVMQKCLDEECAKSEFYVLIGNTLFWFSTYDEAIAFIDYNIEQQIALSQPTNQISSLQVKKVNKTP